MHGLYIVVVLLLPAVLQGLPDAKRVIAVLLTHDGPMGLISAIGTRQPICYPEMVDMHQELLQCVRSNSRSLP